MLVHEARVVARRSVSRVFGPSGTPSSRRTVVVVSTRTLSKPSFFKLFLDRLEAKPRYFPFITCPRTRILSISTLILLSSP